MKSKSKEWLRRAISSHAYYDCLKGSHYVAEALDFSMVTRYGQGFVRKLPEVEEAKSLMMEATDWSVFRWLFEKRRVRETADRANAALDKLNEAVKARWSGDVKAAYKELTAKKGDSAYRRPAEAASLDPEVRIFVKKVKEADDAAYRARMDAEDTFDEAERQLNTDLAREGCQKAIQSWELHEKAIRKAESVRGSTKKTT